MTNDGERSNRPKGYKLDFQRTTNPDTKVVMTDAQVLECQAKYEFGTGWDMKRLAVEYGVSPVYMRRLLDYTTRARLIPKRPT